MHKKPSEHRTSARCAALRANSKRANTAAQLAILIRSNATGRGVLVVVALRAHVR